MKALTETSKINDINYFMNFKEVTSKAVENPTNIANAKMVLTVFQSGQVSHQIWTMMQ